MEEVKKIRYDGLDFIKFVACILVVFIHCQFPGIFGGCMRAIGRIAVPFFLMVSGYFCVNKSLLFDCNGLKKKAKHIINLIFFSFAFFALYHLLMNYHKSPIEVAIDYVSSFSITKFLIINTPSFYKHLWFLLALLYCYLLLFLPFMRRAFLNKSFLLACTFLCIMVFVLSSEILPLYGKEITVLGFKSQHIFLFRALPFFLMGLCARLFQPLEKVAPPILLIMAIIGMFLSLVEFRYQAQDSQAYIGSIICAFLLLLYGLRSKKNFPKKTVVWGNKLSLYVYIYHIAAIVISCKLSPSDWLTPIIVVIISFIMAYITIFIKDVMYIRFGSAT